MSHKRSQRERGRRHAQRVKEAHEIQARMRAQKLYQSASVRMSYRECLHQKNLLTIQRRARLGIRMLVWTIFSMIAVSCLSAVYFILR